jgi:DNA-binding response OmpR family regulator
MAIEDVLAEDGMVALPVPDMHAALTRGIEHLPDLAIVDADLPGPDGVDLIPAFRHRMNRPNFPILLLADRPDAPSDRAESGATDYLAKPYSPPMLRPRRRSPTMTAPRRRRFWRASSPRFRCSGSAAPSN